MCSIFFSKINDAEKLNKEFIKLADRVFVNGEKNLLLFKNELKRNQDVQNNPFCPLILDLRLRIKEIKYFFLGRSKMD